MVYITAVRLRWGSRIQHLSRVRWSQPSVQKMGDASRMDIVRFIRDGGVVRVSDGVREFSVIIVDDHPPVLGTVADGRHTNNLLTLPRF